MPWAILIRKNIINKKYLELFNYYFFKDQNTNLLSEKNYRVTYRFIKPSPSFKKARSSGYFSKYY